MVNFKKIPNDGVKFNQKEYYEDNFDLAALEFEKKVDKVTGKVLSTNDYTTLEKTKLSKVPDDTNASLSALTTDVNAQLAEIVQDIVDANTEIDTKANKAQESWITPTLVNSWVNETGQVTRFMKDSMGFVHVEVFIKNGTATFQKVFDFPVGYRPGQIFYVVGVSGTNHAAAYITTGGSFDFAAGTLTVNNRFAFSFKAV